MPRNGSGQYNPLTNTWNPPVNGVLATGSDFQAQLNDISAAISQSVSKDGQTPMTASFPMGNNSIVGIASGTAAEPSISPINDTNTGVYFPAADTVAIATGATERARITSGGNMLVGTTVDSGYRATFSGGSSVGGTTVDAILLRNSGYGGSNIASINQNNLILSQIDFSTEDFGINNFDDGIIRFSTRKEALSGGALTEHTRITSDGNWLVGTMSGVNHKLFKDRAAGISTQIFNSSTDTSSSAMEVNVNYTGNTTGWFIRGGDSGTYRFYIYSNGNITNTNNSYGAVSDAKLKENIVDATPKLNSLMQVRVVNYNLIGEDGKQLGVVAQELEQVFPSMVHESPDYESVTTTDEDGNDQVEQVATGTTTKSVKYSVFVPMLIKAIQEQQTLIESLTARITALEAK